MFGHLHRGIGLWNTDLLSYYVSTELRYAVLIKLLSNVLDLIEYFNRDHRNRQ